MAENTRANFGMTSGMVTVYGRSLAENAMKASSKTGNAMVISSLPANNSSMKENMSTMSAAVTVFGRILRRICAMKATSVTIREMVRGFSFGLAEHDWNVSSKMGIPLELVRRPMMMAAYMLENSVQTVDRRDREFGIFLMAPAMKENSGKAIGGEKEK